MGSQAALIALMLVATASLASAGCYRNGHKRPTRAGAELRFNHRPAKQLSLDALPAEFTWCVAAGCICMGVAPLRSPAPCCKIPGRCPLLHAPAWHQLHPGPSRPPVSAPKLASCAPSPPLTARSAGPTITARTG